MNKEHHIKILHASGLKATPQRIHILNVLYHTKKPLTIQKLLNEKSSVRINPVTVYRMMNDFYHKGIVRRIDLHHGHAHFELALLHDHHHIVCQRCGIIEDIPECGVKSVVAKALRRSKKFSDIVDHTFELFGVCKKCA